jgi:hypothetical protein
MSAIIKAINLVKALRKPGALVGSILTDGEEDIENNGCPNDESYKALSNCFTQDNNQRYAFAKLSELPDFSDIYELYKVYLNKQYYHRKINHHYDSEEVKLQEVLKRLRKPAEYGDVAKQQTVVDESVRKGFDINLAEINREELIVKINSLLMKDLAALFRQKFGYANIKLEPYKINIYEKGDFFDEHSDSPADGLIGTIIVNMKGPSHTFIIDQKVAWKEDFGEICMFYTDVLHKVNSVPSYRETLTFKVFLNQNDSDQDKVSPAQSKELSNETLNFLKRVNINEEFGVVLQNGYTYIKDNSDDYEAVMKGLDRSLLKTVKELNMNYRLAPVIVTNRKYFTEYSKGYHNYNVKWSLKLSKIDDDDNSNDDDNDNSSDEDSTETKELCNLTVYNLSEAMNVVLEQKREQINPMTVYYLGKGYGIGEVRRSNIYIGNQYTGEAKDNVYLNMMLIATPKKN